MRDKHSVRNAALIAAACAAAATAGACGSDNETASAGPSKEAAAAQAASSSRYSWRRAKGPATIPETSDGGLRIDVGTSRPLTRKAGEPLRIALFQQGQSNAYLQASSAGAKAAAQSVGAKLTVFDAEFKPTTQKAQIQNAIASGRYNAAIAIPIDSPGSCQALTRDLPEANIPVVVIAQQTCGRESERGAKLWSPGTVAWIGHDYPALYKIWTDAVAERLTAGQEAILINGPEGNTAANAAEDAAKATAAESDHLDLVDAARTDYTTSQALASTQNLLRANPKVKTVLLQYGGQLPGVLQALRQAGKAKEVKVYDVGGSSVEKTAVAEGRVEMTVPLYPYTQSGCAVDMLAAMSKGDKVPRVVLNDCHQTGGSADAEDPVLYTKENVAELQAEY